MIQPRQKNSYDSDNQRIKILWHYQNIKHLSEIRVHHIAITILLDFPRNQGINLLSHLPNKKDSSGNAHDPRVATCHSINKIIRLHQRNLLLKNQTVLSNFISRE